MGLADGHAGAGKTTLCKHASGRTQRVSYNKSEILRIVFHSNVGDIRMKTERKADVVAHLAHTISFCLPRGGEILLHPFQCFFHGLAILIGVARQLQKKW